MPPSSLSSTCAMRITCYESVRGANGRLVLTPIWGTLSTFGRHPHFFLDPGGPHPPRPPGPSTTAGEQALRQGREVRFPCCLRGVPRPHLGEGASAGRPQEGTGCGGMGSTLRPYPALAFPWVRQLLPSVHPRIQPGRCSPEAEVAFSVLKNLFTSAPVLILPDPSRQFIVEVDASDVGIGAILSQRLEKKQHLHPVAFLSLHFSPAEGNYDVGNRELLAIHAALDECWRGPSSLFSSGRTTKT